MLCAALAGSLALTVARPAVALHVFDSSTSARVSGDRALNLMEVATPTTSPSSLLQLAYFAEPTGPGLALIGHLSPCTSDQWAFPAVDWSQLFVAEQSVASGESVVVLMDAAMRRSTPLPQDTVDALRAIAPPDSGCSVRVAKVRRPEVSSRLSDDARAIINADRSLTAGRDGIAAADPGGLSSG
jgi:hypothetical protein